MPGFEIAISRPAAVRISRSAGFAIWGQIWIFSHTGILARENPDLTPTAYGETDRPMFQSDSPLAASVMLTTTAVTAVTGPIAREN